MQTMSLDVIRRTDSHFIEQKWNSDPVPGNDKNGITARVDQFAQQIFLNRQLISV